jgi:hypothetical protein
MIGALHQIVHVGGRMNRQRMLGKAGPRGDIARHFMSQSELVIRSRCKQGNHQIFQRDDTDAQRYEFGIGQIRDGNSLGFERRIRGGPVGTRAAFVVLPGQSVLTLVPVAGGIGFFSRHA